MHRNRTQVIRIGEVYTFYFQMSRGEKIETRKQQEAKERSCQLIIREAADWELIIGMRLTSPYIQNGGDREHWKHSMFISYCLYCIGTKCSEYTRRLCCPDNYKPIIFQLLASTFWRPYEFQKGESVNTEIPFSQKTIWATDFKFCKLVDYRCLNDVMDFKEKRRIKKVKQ